MQSKLSLVVLRSGFFFALFLCDVREQETPSPIPNLEAKWLIADNTASFRCGNVGNRIKMFCI
jgi:hypothetical protein